jgi:hypothetical protein
LSVQIGLRTLFQISGLGKQSDAILKETFLPAVVSVLNYYGQLPTRDSKLNEHVSFVIYPYQLQTYYGEIIL